jgi:hypothetical protein
MTSGDLECHQSGQAFAPILNPASPVAVLCLCLCLQLNRNVGIVANTSEICRKWSDSSTTPSLQSAIRSVI